MLKLSFLLGAAAFAAAASAAEEPPLVKLVSGTSKPANTKPAAIFYTDDGYGSSSHSINAAVISRGIHLPALSIAGTVASEATFAAGISKDTLASAPSDVRALTANLGANFFQEHRVKTAAIFSLENDAQNDNRGNSWRLDAELDSRWLKYDPNLDKGKSGAGLKVFPSVGYYQRRISSSDDEAKAPTGRYGGPYASVHIVGSFGTVTSDFKWYERIGLDIAAFRIRDSSVSGGYTTDSYNFATGTISYALHDYTADRVRVWKPSIAFTREVGTDRLNNKPKTAENKIGLQISYGL